MFLMVIAGNETTTKLLANAAYLGSRRTPTSWRRCTTTPPGSRCGSRRRCATTPPARSWPAPSSGELTLYDTTMPDGDVLLLLPGSANRDDRVFEDPDDYLIGREIGSKLVSFGSGAHFCLGAHLARMEARVALAELFKRIRGYEVDEANAVRVHSSNVRGFAHLPMHRGGPLDAPVRTTPRPQARDRRGRVVRYRRGHRDRARRPRLPGRARCPPGGEVRGARRQDPRRRWRGGRAAPRRHRPRLGQGLRAPGHRRARRHRGAGRRRGRHLLRPARTRSAPTSSNRRSRSTSSAPTGWPPRCCPAWSSASAAT